MTRSIDPGLIAALRGLALAAVLLGATAPSAAREEVAVAAEAPEPRGVLLGRFMLRDLRTVEGAKTRLSFSLHGVASGDALLRLQRLVPHFEHRIRSEVATAVRLTPLPDFQQPGLDRFRRRVLARLRRSLPTLVIDALLIGEFELFLD